jgi:hypothetical protein
MDCDRLFRILNFHERCGPRITSGTSTHTSIIRRLLSSLNILSGKCCSRRTGTSATLAFRLTESWSLFLNIRSSETIADMSLSWMQRVPPSGWRKRLLRLKVSHYKDMLTVLIPFCRHFVGPAAFRFSHYGLPGLMFRTPFYLLRFYIGIAVLLLQRQRNWFGTPAAAVLPGYERAHSAGMSRWGRWEGLVVSTRHRYLIAPQHARCHRRL